MLKSRIPLIIADLNRTTLEGVVEAAEQIVVDAQQRVPVDSGALRDAIHVESDGNTVRVVAGGDGVFYGHIVEFGGVNVNSSPQPFLIPALEANRENLEDIIGEKLRDL